MESPSSRRRMFTGEHAYRVDSQRRVALPKAWRGEGEDASFMLLAPDEPCIHMMPQRMFDRVYDRMQEELLSNLGMFSVFSSIGSNAADVTCDKQGRFALPPELMKHAGITESVVLVGGFVTISIWDPEVWRTRRQTLAQANRALQSVFTKPDNLTKAFQQAMGVQPDS